MQIKHLRITDEGFPQALRNIPGPPQEIFVQGDLAPLMAHPRLAIVGTRKVTPYGRAVTTKLATEVAEQGITIVSGLALGIDAIGHQAALAAKGKAIAVLAGGLDHITPSTNAYLARQILEQGGALVSEYPPGAPPLKVNFIARNRLVSGLSDGVLITEAAIKSGTYHTAMFALEQAKPVMAVPGNITSYMSGGTNMLIKTGALAVTSTEDILQALGLDHKTLSQTQLFGNSPEEALLLKLLYEGITDAGNLLKRSKLDTALFNQTLTLLELTGKIHALGANQWSL